MALQNPVWLDTKSGEVVYEEPEEGRVIVAAGEDLTSDALAARLSVYDVTPAPVDEDVDTAEEVADEAAPEAAPVDEAAPAEDDPKPTTSRRKR